jgi:DNA-binding IclR family transcriptional regulator
MLAFASQEHLEEFLHERKLESYTRNTITSLSRFRAELRAIRKRGYAIDNEEREQGLRCIGAPLRDSTGEVIAAISIAGPVFRIGEERVPTLASTVMRIAAAISASLGYRGIKTKVDGEVQFAD